MEVFQQLDTVKEIPETIERNKRLRGIIRSRYARKITKEMQEFYSQHRYGPEDEFSFEQYYEKVTEVRHNTRSYVKHMS